MANDAVQPFAVPYPVPGVLSPKQTLVRLHADGS